MEREIWERYAACWKATAESDKLALCRACLDEECVYSDPLTLTRGVDELVAYMLQFHAQVPGAHFATTSFFTQRGQCIVSWEMRSAEQEKIGQGMSYGEFAADGRLKVMRAFFSVPAA